MFDYLLKIFYTLYMRKILICFAYKGTNYSGYQKQPNKITVQSVLEDCLSKVLKENINIIASGRTDAGVHALKQYAHFECENKIDLNKLPTALNTFLPPDIRVYSAKEVDGLFNARTSAKTKTYMYVFCKDKIINPMLFDMVSKLEYNVDINLIKNCMEKIIGTHNFKAFCSSKTCATSFIRTIYDFTMEEKQNYLIFKISGNGFLYNMVRIIIGTIIDIARRHLDISCIEDMFKTGNRALGGKTVDGRGLYLFDVKYE